MSTKPQTPAQPKQARSRKAATADSSTGRAGSAGGVVLSKEAAKKPSTGKPAAVPSKDMKTTVKPETAKPDTPRTQDTPKKKPRKLNRDPTSTVTSTPASTPRPATDAGELEALKSRVRGLEAKVEDLYKSSGGATSTPRSPRRRGKGRKNSSATTTATLENLARKNTQEGELEDGGVRGDEEEDAEAEEELERLESELENARHDLALYTPRRRPLPLNNNGEEEEDDVEDIPRPPLRSTQSDRQVTLSGSYRIPLPASLNPEDVRTIQSGVSAAQNVARSFMEQRRARAGPTTTTTSTSASTGTSTASASASAAGGSRAKSAMDDASGKSDGQTWGDWIGGYSVAISRAVRSIEHEAGVEGRNQSQSLSQGQGQTQAQRKKGQGQVKKRPGAATRLSGEQVQGLMG